MALAIEADEVIPETFLSWHIPENIPGSCWCGNTGRQTPATPSCCRFSPSSQQ